MAPSSGSSFLKNSGADMNERSIFLAAVEIHDPTARAAMDSMGDPQTAAAMINQMATQQGYQISFNEVFHVLGWVFISLVLVIWLTRPPFLAKAGPAASGGH